MRLIQVSPDDLDVSPDLVRSSSVMSFEERLRSSIDEIGLVEPLKIAKKPSGGFLVIDGNLRLKAVNAIRAREPHRFTTIPAYVLAYSKRYEIRFQSDIYQDLLPSQLATLVEHLHKAENVRKVDIARYIGVSPPTLRNYTGLWRLLERGGLFARIVELMDIGVLPASNPYAWLRLTEPGLEQALTLHFTDGEAPETWITRTIREARLGQARRYQLKQVEMSTASLPSYCYRVEENVRTIKRDLGLRRAADRAVTTDLREARGNLGHVSSRTSEPVLRLAASALSDYLS